MRTPEIPLMSEAFARALIGGEVEKIHAFLNSGENVHSVGTNDLSHTDSYLSYPLQLAAMSGHPPAISALLERGVDVNWAPPNAVGALHAATRNYAIFRMLLDAGADPNKDGSRILNDAVSWQLLQIRLASYGSRSLNDAVSQQQKFPVIAALLDAGAQLNSNDIYRDDIASVITHAEGWTMVEYLISRGFDINGQDKRGDTAMHCAAKSDNPLAINELVRLGARVDTIDREGRQPLHVSIEYYGAPEVFKALLRHGASISARSADGLSLLEYALQHGRPGIALELMNEPNLAGGADLNHLLVLAARTHSDDLAPLVHELLRRGADPHTVDEKGRALLQITRSAEIKRVVRAARTANKLESAMQRDESAPSKPSSGGMAPL